MSQRIKTLLILATMAVFSLIQVDSNAQSTPPETFTYVKFYTNKGNFTVRLFNDTPLHRDNFIQKAKAYTFDDLLFHRVIRNFMVQAGGAKRGMESLEGTELEALDDEMIPAEIIYPKHYHKRGMLAAARVSNEENPEKKSSGLQFYVVVGQFYLEKELVEIEKSTGMAMPENIKKSYMTEGGTPHLDHEYTVFGEITDGMKTIMKIQSIETNSEDRPVKDIFIKRTEVFVK